MVCVNLLPTRDEISYHRPGTDMTKGEERFYSENGTIPIWLVDTPWKTKSFEWNRKIKKTKTTQLRIVF